MQLDRQDREAIVTALMLHESGKKTMQQVCEAVHGASKIKDGRLYRPDAFIRLLSQCPNS